MFCINADGADTADNALNPLTVAEVADTLVLKADVELRSVNLALTPLIAAEDTLVAALILVADIVGAKAEGADTADKALSPLTVAEVADTLVLSADVELRSVNRAETPLIAAELTLVAALILVAEYVTEYDEVELKSVNLPETALTEVPLIFPPLRFVRAEMLVPDIVGESTSVALRSVNLDDTELTEVPEIVTAKDEVELKSTTLVAAEKLTAPVTVPPDKGK